MFNFFIDFYDVFLTYYSTSPVSLSTNSIRRSAPNASAILCISLSLKLSRFILLCRFWGEQFSILPASSDKLLMFFLIIAILIFCSSATCITSVYKLYNEILYKNDYFVK